MLGRELSAPVLTMRIRNGAHLPPFPPPLSPLLVSSEVPPLADLAGPSNYVRPVGPLPRLAVRRLPCLEERARRAASGLKGRPLVSFADFRSPPLAALAHARLSDLSPLPFPRPTQQGYSASVLQVADPYHSLGMQVILLLHQVGLGANPGFSPGFWGDCLLPAASCHSLGMQAIILLHQVGLGAFFFLFLPGFLG